MGTKTTKMELNCNNKQCQHTWNYNGKSKFWATCPNCRHKVSLKNQETEIKQLEKNNKTVFTIPQ